MSDPAVREATASEELTLEQEYEMQGELMLKGAQETGTGTRGELTMRPCSVLESRRRQ
jgi:hypothetical protein